MPILRPVHAISPFKYSEHLYIYFCIVIGSAAAPRPVYPFTHADRNLQVVAPSCFAFFRLSLLFHLVTLGRRQRKMERERKRRKRRGVVGRGLYIRDISRGIVSVVVVRLLNDFLHHRYYFLDETRALLALGFILNFPCVVLGCDRGLSWLVYRFGIVNDSEDRGPKWFVGCYEA